MIRLSDALRWITRLFEEEGIPYQVVGGVAARAYGSKRPVLDIDIYIPEAGLFRLLPRVRTHLTRPPARYKSDLFDVNLTVLNYGDREIELCTAEGARLFDSKMNRWVPHTIHFNESTRRPVEGVPVPLIPLGRLIEYKNLLGRPVDLQDIEEMSAGRKDFRC